MPSGRFFMPVPGRKTQAARAFHGSLFHFFGILEKTAVRLSATRLESRRGVLSMAN
jgi:hypothetical protein